MEIRLNRVKNMLLSTKAEWAAVEAEDAPHMKVFKEYVVLLAIIPAVAALIGYGLIGYNVLGTHVANFGYGVRQALLQYAAMLGGTYLTAFVIDTLAASFGARKNFDRAFSLTAYACTPMFVGGVFYLLPPLSWLASLCGLYSLYLLYTGLQPMMKVSAEKQASYFVVSLLVTVFVAVILYLVLRAIFLSGMNWGI